MSGLSVLFASESFDGTLSMGGSKANGLLLAALRGNPLVGEVMTTKPDMPKTGHDILIVEAPTGTPFIEACAPAFTFVLRHGDTPLGNCAYERFDRPDTAMLVPSNWATRSLPRVAHFVQYMALERPPGEVPPMGKKVLHARAYDFMKDTRMAIEVAREAPEVEFVFRLTPGAFAGDLPPNVTVELATHGPELWEDIGAVLLTSRAETFSMIAYEAVCRGLRVVAHASLGVLREWADPYPCTYLADTAQGLAESCRMALEVNEPARLAAIDCARDVHLRSFEQMNYWLGRAHMEIRR
jgi:hypothetical protein